MTRNLSEIPINTTELGLPDWVGVAFGKVHSGELSKNSADARRALKEHYWATVSWVQEQIRFIEALTQSEKVSFIYDTAGDLDKLEITMDGSENSVYASQFFGEDWPQVKQAIKDGKQKIVGYNAKERTFLFQ